MARQEYQSINFNASTLLFIEQLNSVIREYQAGGYSLTVRQLYYQMVARDIIPNTERSYKRTTDIVNNARMAGLMDWDAIVDRTRSMDGVNSWASPGHIIRNAASWYHMDMWDNQQSRVFCIVEKEALVGVLERPCQKYDIPLLAARGYPSGTVLREFARERVMEAGSNGQSIIILHFGDHDPSGIDMSRDLEERIRMFAEADAYEYDIDFRRLALEMWQIEDQDPPPNPAKVTDSRFAEYEKKFGSKSWELDALEPEYIAGLVEDEVQDIIDDEAWAEIEELTEKGRAEITRVSKLAIDPRDNP